MEGSNLTATVKVKGHRNACIVESSEAAVIKSRISCAPGVTYGKEKSMFDEFQRLDNFFITLQNAIGSRGHILFEIEKTEKLYDVPRRLSKLMRHFEFRNFSRDLVIFDVCYAEQNQTTFRIIPDGAEFPDMTECEKVKIDLK
jgi:hypothetical protein